jgi:hypothetical protein
MADSLLNMMLFLPLGATLSVAGWRPLRAFALGELLSFGLDAALLIPPRSIEPLGHDAHQGKRIIFEPALTMPKSLNGGSERRQRRRIGDLHRGRGSHEGRCRDQAKPTSPPTAERAIA